MNSVLTKVKYDFVGSFLRPQALKDAKKELNEGRITREDYDCIVEYEIIKLVKKQKDLGFNIITDGEFRRSYWHLDFMWGFEGVEHRSESESVSHSVVSDSL